METQTTNAPIVAPESAELKAQDFLFWCAAGLLGAVILAGLEIALALPTHRSLETLHSFANVGWLAGVYVGLGLAIAVILWAARVPLGEQPFGLAMSLVFTVLIIVTVVYQINLIFYAAVYAKAYGIQSLGADLAGLLVLLLLVFRWRKRGVRRHRWIWLAGLVLVSVLALSTYGFSQSLLYFRANAHDAPISEYVSNQYPYEIPPIPADDNRPNVLLICIDTLRADAVGAYGNPRPNTPNIDKLAQTGVLFKQAASQSSWTVPSVGSYMTGLYPHKTGAVKMLSSLADFTTTIAEIMRAAGYQTGAFISNPWLKRCFKFDAGFDYYDDSPVSDDVGDRLMGTSLVKALGEWRPRDMHYQSRADVLVNSFRKWLKGRESEPLFAYLHFIDPHTPYTPLPEILKELYPDELNRFKGIEKTAKFGPREIETLQMMYWADVRYADFHFGELLKHYRASVQRPTLVVLFSDHGEGFNEHGVTEHGNNLFHEEVAVPFIWSFPEVLPAGRSVDRPVALMDLMPTLCHLCRVPVPNWVEGENLVRSMLEDSDTLGRPIYAELDRFLFTNHLSYSVRLGARKLVFDLANEYRVAFDLDNDPRELHPVQFDSDRGYLTLEMLLNQYLVSVKAGGVEGKRVKVSEDTMDQFRNLGYF